MTNPIDNDARIQEAATPGRWWYEDGQWSWNLYATGTDDPDAIVHGYKLIKAPKESEEIACYWPRPPDAEAIVNAHNRFPLYIELARAVDDFKNARRPTVAALMATYERMWSALARLTGEPT